MICFKEFYGGECCSFFIGFNELVSDLVKIWVI